MYTAPFSTTSFKGEEQEEQYSLEKEEEEEEEPMSAVISSLTPSF